MHTSSPTLLLLRLLRLPLALDAARFLLLFSDTGGRALKSLHVVEQALLVLLVHVS